MRLALPLLLLATAASACAAGRAAPPASDPAAAIRSMLERSADAWTRGDLEGFLADYADDATFVTSDGPIRGRDRIRAMYRTGYWRDGAAPDALRFDDLDIRQVAPDAAVAFGRYVLYDRGSRATTATGTFSLTLRRTGEEWEIVHDHSSSDG